MNLEQVKELEKIYFNTENYISPTPCGSNKGLRVVIYKSNYANIYYMFLADWLALAFEVDGGVGFMDENDLKRRLQDD